MLLPVHSRDELGAMADAFNRMVGELFASKPKEMARVTGAMISAFDIAQKHPEAKIPRTATFWDENLDAISKIAREPGLAEQPDFLVTVTTQNLVGVVKFKGWLADAQSNVPLDDTERTVPLALLVGATTITLPPFFPASSKMGKYNIPLIFNFLNNNES